MYLANYVRKDDFLSDLHEVMVAMVTSKKDGHN